MDEPFAALDAITRDVLQGELLRVWEATGTTILFVTHDVREAVRLAERVVLLSSRPGTVVRRVAGRRRADGAARGDHRAAAAGHHQPCRMTRPRCAARYGRRPHDPTEAAGVLEDAAAAVAGLDALDTPTTTHHALVAARPGHRAAAAGGAGRCSSLVWQARLGLGDHRRVQGAGADRRSGHEFTEIVDDGQVWSILWTSISRAFLGFVVALVIATPLGLLVAKVPVVRAAIGPLLSGLQSLPSVAWVPAAVLWFGLTDATIYFVVLAGSIPSIANGLVAGIDQIPPILPRVGQVLGARGLTSARHILLPAALPGYLAGCKQGWAFSWRSLMAAEIIAAGPLLGFGLGAYLKQGSDFNDMPDGDRRDLPDPRRRHRHRAAGVPAGRAPRAARPRAGARRPDGHDNASTCGAPASGRLSGQRPARGSTVASGRLHRSRWSHASDPAA